MFAAQKNSKLKTMTSKKLVNLSLAGIAFCCVTFFILPSCQNKNKSNTTQGESSKGVSHNEKTAGIRVAYVNIDTLEAKYAYFKESKEAFEKKQNTVEAQLKSSATKLQNEYMSFQKKAQAGSLTQAEGEAAQKRLGKMQEDLENKRQRLTTQLMEEQEKFTQKLQSQLDSFLLEFNKDQKYDYIFSYMKGGNILLANPNYDITAEVIKGMNKAYQANKEKK